MSFIFPRGTRRLPPIWVDDIPDSVKVEMFDMLMKDMLKRPLRYINVGGFNMHNNKEELLKDLIKIRAIDEMESDPLVTTAERKKRLMRLEKEMLVDMVFNLESKNETFGEWVYADKIAGMRYYRCSICATGYNTIANENEINWWRFCPRCGSKMFTKEEE